MFLSFQRTYYTYVQKSSFFVKKRRQKRNGGNKMPKEYYLYVNGQRVKVSEQIYKVYWREKEHEKYLEQVDKKNHLLFFS